MEGFCLGEKLGALIALVAEEGAASQRVLCNSCRTYDSSPCVSRSLGEMQESQLKCQTSPSNVSTQLPITVKYGDRERRLEGSLFTYTLDPNITFAEPPKSFLRYQAPPPPPPRPLQRHALPQLQGISSCTDTPATGYQALTVSVRQLCIDLRV